MSYIQLRLCSTWPPEKPTAKTPRSRGKGRNLDGMVGGDVIVKKRLLFDQMCSKKVNEQTTRRNDEGSKNRTSRKKPGIHRSLSSIRDSIH